MLDQKYTADGYLIVSETDKCPLWEKDTVPCRAGRTQACFFCKYADFRTEETIRRAEEMPWGIKLYSVCQNEHNRKKESDERGNHDDHRKEFERNRTDYDDCR